MELKLLCDDTIDSRATEKWQMTTVVPSQPPAVSLQWYDQQLKLAVREEFPGGDVRELKGIRVGSQPDELFTVPAGYTRKAPPQGGPAPADAPKPGGQ